MTNEAIIQQLQHLIGSRYVPAVKAYIVELTGRTRVFGPNDVVTREFDINRITVDVDANNLVESFSFG